MDRLLARLERTFLGRLAIERLTTFIVGGMAIVFVLALAKPQMIDALALDPALVPTQPWRLVTFLFIPTSRSIFWILFALMFVHFVGTSLESNWGAFKFNVYYFLGAIGTIVGAYVTGQPRGNLFLNESLFFALATLAPNHQILLLIVPVRLKWLALFAAALITFQFIEGDTGTRVAIAISFINYFVFFTGELVALARGRRIAVRQAARRASFSAASEPPPAERACAICGARQADGADIRVCACEKCGGPRELCLEHARNH